MSRQFKLLDNTTGKVTGTFNGKTPYQAALKAASRHDSIMLCEHYGNAKYSNKVHVYKGSVQQLSSDKQTPFTLKHGITSRPHVVKMGMMSRPLRQSENQYDPEVMALEDKCSKIFPESGGDCSSPCEIHPSSGNCFYPGA